MWKGRSYTTEIPVVREELIKRKKKKGRSKNQKWERRKNRKKREEKIDARRDARWITSTSVTRASGALFLPVRSRRGNISGRKYFRAPYRAVLHYLQSSFESVALVQHFSQHFSGDKAPFVRGHTPHYYSQLRPFTRLHSTGDTWHYAYTQARTHTPWSPVVCAARVRAYTRTYIRT